MFLSASRGYSAGFVFALTAWGGLVAAAFYALNAFFGDRVERRTMVLLGAIVFAGGWYGMYNVHSTPAVVILYIALADRRGHLLVEHVRLRAAELPDPDARPGHRLDRRRGPPRRLGRRPALRAGLHRRRPLGWILLVTIPGALLPGVMVGFFGIRQRRRTLEELSQ